MILGMAPFLFFHVAISVIGIVSGLFVAYGLVANRLEETTVIFLVTTILTSVTGFFLSSPRRLRSISTSSC